jgi:hypothetical protein
MGAISIIARTPPAIAIAGGILMLIMGLSAGWAVLGIGVLLQVIFLLA